MAKKYTRYKGSTPSRKIVTLPLFAVALPLLILGLIRLHDRYNLTSGTAQLPIPTEIISKDIEKPQESFPDTNSYKVAAQSPKSISLPSIGVNGLIKNVGLNPANAIAVPTNINYGGWFTGSILSGEKGLSIIDGHVSGRYRDAIFKNLNQVKIGEFIMVEYGDASVKRFEVMEIITVDEKNSAAILFAQKVGIEKQLNLITCGGKYDNNLKTFDRRVIVISKSID